MGRYYFTLGQIFDSTKFEDALSFFEKATALAPSNVIYHNLWAQTLYIMQDYDAAIDRLQKSISIDARYPPSWILLGDTYAAKGDADKALQAHVEGINVGGWSNFADQFLDQRLGFYISAGRGEDIIAAIQQYALEKPNDPRLQWAIGHAYNLRGDRDRAIPYFEQAIALGDTSARTVRELANMSLAAENFEQAASYYQLLLQQNPNDVEAHSALAFVAARQGQVDEAIMHNQAVLQQAPNDYDSLKNLAILFQQAQRWQEALDAARQAQAVAPEAEQASWIQFITDLETQMAAQN
jgi:tetratricopeptide (TPR) repeat protein